MGALRKLAWDLTLRTSGDTTRRLGELRRWQWLGADAAAALQRRRLGDLLAHARARVPYYRDLFASLGLADAAPAALADALPSLPLLDKDVIRREGDRLRAEDAAARRPYTNTSGGSTGEPVALVQDAAYRDAARAVAMLFGQWAGYDAGYPMVKVWGSERDLFVGRETWRTRGVRALRNEHWLNSFRTTPGELRTFLDVLDARRPRFVLGYVESLYDLARTAMADGRTIHAPRAVMTAAGPLDPHVRDVIRRAFGGAPVYNRYGSREVGDVACECDAHQGLHVCSPHHVVELLDDAGRPVAPGERGEVVVTLLTNRSMPLVRYRIGDVAAWATGACPCGRAWPRLENVTGRVSDIFERADGTRVHGEYFTHLFYFLPWVRKFQVVQEAHDDVRVRVVPVAPDDRASDRTRRDLDEVAAKIRLVLGDDCAVRVEWCDAIEPTASGKFRYTISKVTA